MIAPQNFISAWFAASLWRPRVRLALRSTLLLASLILTLYALGMVRSR